MKLKILTGLAGADFAHGPGDIVDQPDTVWYITEYCSGGSLWYLLPHAGTPSTSAPTTVIGLG